MSFFGEAFDLDFNGELDPLEKGALFGFLAEMADSEEDEELYSEDDE